MKKKILVVDDSGTALMLEKMILGQRDYDIVVARDGQEAVEKAGREHPDLILMDVVMPRLDGFGACQRIRGQQGTEAIPIIMVTTRGNAQHVEDGFRSGCSDYVTKPINGLELLSKVKSFLGE
jgi:DNA-binding response OmpR family regulator